MQVATLLRCGPIFVADMFGEEKRLMIANVLDAQMLDIEPVGDVQREPADPTSGGAEHLPVERAVLMPEPGNSCRHMRWIEPARPRVALAGTPRRGCEARRCGHRCVRNRGNCVDRDADRRRFQGEAAGEAQIAALLAAYALEPAMPKSPELDVVDTIRPYR